MSDPSTIAADETERLRALRALDIVGTPPEFHFDAVCRTATALFGVPIALVSMVDEKNQWFKGRCGLIIDGTGRDLAFCHHTIETDAVFVIEDTARDTRFAGNTLVTGEPGIRFYAGVPLALEPGLRIGALCVMDTVPRTFSDAQSRQLEDLGAVVVAHLRLHAANGRIRHEIAARRAQDALITEQAATLQDRETTLEETNRLLIMAEEMAHIGHWRLDLAQDRRTWSAETYRIFGLDPESDTPDANPVTRHPIPGDLSRLRDVVAEAGAERRDFDAEIQILRPGGEARVVAVRGTYEHGLVDGPGFSGVIMDVTDLHRTTSRLRESEDRFRLLVDGITDGSICMIDTAGIVTNWSAGAEQVHGYVPHDIVGRHVGDLHADVEEGRTAIEGALARAVATERAEIEGWRRRKDDTRFFASTVIQPIRDDHGTLLGFAELTRDVTEQRRAAEALRNSEARYRLLTDRSTDMIVQLDATGRRLYVSPASQELLGYAPAELIGTDIASCLYPGDADAFRTLLARLVTGAEDRAVSVLRLKHRDGRLIWIEASLHVLLDADGRPEGVLASVRDTTDRRRAEEALRESETRYRILADTLPQMVWIMDRESRDTIYVNRQFEAYHGAIGMRFADRISRYHPDDRPTVERAWSKSLVALSGLQADVRLQRRDGIYRWHKLVVVPIHRDDGVGSWLCTALDIHDAVIAQEALRQSSDLLRIAQEAAGAGAWDVDLVGDAVITLSPESAAMHGLDGTEPVVLTVDGWNGLAHPDDTPAVWAEVWRAIEAHDLYSAEFRVPQPDGSIRWIQGIGRAYYDAQGNPVRLIGLNFDVDKRKRVESALIEASQAAETARREAETASVAKTDFLAAMSHEIRTPLNSILGYTELLLDGAHHVPEDRRKLDRILGSGRALLTIVNDVLDFSKIEAGRVELEPEAFPLVELVADTMSMIRGLATEKPLTLRAELDPDLPARLVGDQNRLRQVLLNLMNNAVKFTRAGEVVLTMRCENRTAEALELRCEVSDTGIGIPDDRRDRLFLRFSQLDGSITRRFGGTGLGLAISKSLVELMGGEIGVAQRPGPGSTFWFTVELALCEDGPASPDVAPAIEPPHRPARILLVEDVPMNREIAEAMLTSGGHRVDIASDGAEAVQAVQDVAYDVVLMDVQMPVMDGIEATARIRSLGGRFVDLPILALTANVLTEQVAAFRSAGMVDHIGKPFRRTELLDAVARWARAGILADDAGATDPDVVDRETFDELSALLGRDKLGRMLRDLESILASGFVLDPLTLAVRHGDPDELAGTAHKLVSSAGMLGFMALSTTCRAFEGAFRTDQFTSAHIDAMATASRAVLAVMDELRCELNGSPSEGQAIGPLASAAVAPQPPGV